MPTDALAGSPLPARVQLGRSGVRVGPLGVAGGYGVGAGSLRRAFDRVWLKG